MRNLVLAFCCLCVAQWSWAQGLELGSVVQRREAGTVLYRGQILNPLQAAQGGLGLKFGTPVPFTSFALAWQVGNPNLTPSSFSLHYRVHRPGKGWRAWSTEEGAYAPSENALGLYTSDLLFGLDEGQHDSLEFYLVVPNGQVLQATHLILQDMSGHEASSFVPQPPAPEQSSTPCPAVPTFVLRSNWCGSFTACQTPTYTPTYLTAPTHTVIHHGASPDSYTDGHAIVRSYWNYHVNTLGWSDIGYNYLFDRFGNTFVGRHNPNYLTQDVRGAHAGSSNSASIGLSFLGNAELSANVPTIALDRCTQLLAWWYNRRGLSPTSSANIINQPGTQTLNLPRICGHRDLNATACPGTILYNYLATFRSGANQIIQNCQALAAPTLSATAGCQTGSVTVTTNLSTSQTFQLLNSSGTTVLQTWTGTASSYTFTGLANGTYTGRIVRNGQTSALSAASTLSNSPASVGGTVSGGATICQGQTSGTMTLSGHTGSVLRWERRLNSGTWASLSNTATTYSETPSSAGTWQYRAVVRSGSCAEAFSAAFTLTVQATSLGGTVTGSLSSLCQGQATGTMSLSGHRGSVLRWERRLNAGTWVSITNTATTYSEVPGSAGTWEYRAVVQNSPCAVATSSVFTVTATTTPVGSLCSCPINVSLPLVNYQSHTANFGNNYQPAQVTPSFSGLEANEAVFQFSLSSRSEVTATLGVSGIWGSMLLTNTCPNATAPTTYLNSLLQWNGGSMTTTLDPGTYRIIVSSSSIWTLTMPFTLNISATSQAARTSTSTLQAARLSVDVFPNPAVDQIQVRCSEEPQMLRVVNSMGSVQWEQQQPGQSQLQISLPALTPGLYFLQVIGQEGNMETKSFMIGR